VSENFVTSLERRQDPDEKLQLHDTLQEAFFDSNDPATSALQQQEQLDAIITSAHTEVSMDEYGHAVVNHCSAIVKYLWFGGHMTEPPEGVGYYDAGYVDNDWGEFRLKETVISSATFDAVTQTLMPLGLADLLTERADNLKHNIATVENAYETYIAAMPAARWLNAFKAGEPITERPLTPIERATAETALYANTLRRFGPAPHAPRQVHPAAYRHLARQKSLLDDQTLERPQHRQQDDIALQRLRTFAEATIELHRSSTEPIYRREYNESDGTLVEYGCDGQELDDHDLVMVSLDQVEALNWPLERDHSQYEISREFFIEAFEGAYADVASFDEVYEKAMVRSKQAYLERFTQGYNLVTSYHAFEAIRCTKRAKDGRPFDYETLDRGKGQYRSFEDIEEVGFPTETDYERQARIRIGTIERYNDPTPGVLRLVQQAYEVGNLPSVPVNPSEADLILSLKSFQGDPEVPGYRLIAADRLNRRFFLAYDAEHDPYLDDYTLVSTETQSHLAKSYAALQLKELAEAVHRLSRPTVAALAEAVRQNNLYAFRSPLSPDLSGTLGDLESFKPFIRDQKLQATCGIYAKFGQASVSKGIVGDKEEAFVTGGFVLDAKASAISGIPHAQLAIRDKESYKVRKIIDWTPAQASSPAAKLPKELEHKSRSNQFTPEPTAYSLGNERKAPPPTTLREQVALTTRTLLMQLGVTFAPGATEQVPDEYIYTKARKLGAHHPINRALGALLIAGDQLTTSSQLPQQTVGMLHDTQAEILRLQTQRGHKPLPMLDLLSTTLQPVFDRMSDSDNEAHPTHLKTR
jgi:hypothetical protein